MVCLGERLNHTVIGNGNGLMSPLIGALYQGLCLSNAVHIAHFCMAVKLHPFLRAGIHSCTGKVCNFFDSGNGTNGQFTVKTVNGGNAFQLQKGSLFYLFFYFRNLLVPQEHFDHNRVCKIRNRKNKNGFFIPDLSCLYIQNLTSYNDFSHFPCNVFQRNGFTLKISSIYNIWIAVSSESTPEVASMSLFVKGFFLLLSFSGSFFILFFVRTGRGFLLFRRFFLFIQLCMFQDIFHFLLNLKNCIFPVLAFLSLFKLKLDLQIHSAAFTEYLMKIFHKDFTFFPGDHRIRKHQIHFLCAGKSNSGPFKKIIFQHIVIPQLQFHAGPVHLQKIIRRILSGQTELFDHRYLHLDSRKALSFNLLLQLYDIFFVDPPFTADINPQSGLIRIAGHPGDSYHIQKLLQRILDLQIWKYVKKIFFHFFLFLILPSEEALLSGYPEADPPEPFL